MAWDLPAVLTLATERTAAWFNKYKSCFDALALHAHSGADGDGADLELPHFREAVDIPLWFPEAGGQWATYTVTGAPLGYMATTGALNDEGEWKVWLHAGTIHLTIPHVADTNRGKVTVYIDGISVGIFDEYNGAGSYLTNGSISGISRTTDGYATVKMKVTTKNGSSSGYAANALLLHVEYS